MSKINYIIQPQNFETIRDRIGAILLIEIGNQVTLGGDYTIDADVLVERKNPLDNIEDPIIIIGLAAGAFDNKEQGTVRGAITYNIDIYVDSRSAPGSPGDQKAALILQKLLGLCRAILENQAYKTLDFTTPFINRTLCSEINIRNTNGPDALNVAMGRLTFMVWANESTEFKDAPMIGDYYTTVKIELTNKGYQYKKSIPIV